MEIKSAKFIISNTDINLCPGDRKPEYAFIGRSNVGKSSLINMLTNQKELAKTSSRPGKTLLINHFLINEEWYIVDLPGYGFAKTSMTEKEKLSNMISEYINNRENLINLFVLIDSRHEPMKIDMDFLNFLGENGVPFSIVFTKTDKQSKSKTDKNIQAYKNKLKETWEDIPPVFITSAEKRTGKKEILDYIESINSSL